MAADSATPISACRVSSTATALWYALHTRSRHEKLVDRLLWEQVNVESFLPLRTVRRRWADRWKEVRLPLFPGYLFVRAPEERLAQVRRTRGVVCVLGTDRPTPVEEREIENIRRMVGSDLPLDPYPYLRRGDRVRIRRGPLRGLEGILVRRKNRHLVVVSVHLIGRSVAVEVDADGLERC